MGYTFENLVNDPAEARLIILVLVLIPLCIVATLLRLVASKRSRRRFGLDDLFAMLALVAFLIYACTPIVGKP